MKLGVTKASASSSYNGLGDQLYDLGGARPTLDLNFSSNGSLVDSVTGKTLVDHTRQSSATYVDGDGVIRTAVTNLLLQSEDFSTTWSATAGVTVTTNQETAPDGTLTADKLVFSGSSQGIQQGVASLVSGASYVYSIYIKGVAGETIRLGGTNGLNPLNITLDGTWQRFETSGILTATNTTPGINTNVGTAREIFVWGAQLEESSTVGQYVKTTTAKNGAPRFDHDPTTGESLGLLVEESRTNLFAYSEDFTEWTLQNISGNGSIGTQSVTTPDGSSTSYTITTGASPGTGDGVNSSGSVSDSQTITASIYLKAGTAVGEHRLRLRFIGGTTADGDVFYDLASGVVISEDSGRTGTISDVGNGWYRLTITGTNNATGNTSVQLFVYAYDTTAGTYHLWGAQLEAGSFPTSYIPTEGSTVTRAADVASITGTNFSSWYEQDEGTVFVNAKAQPQSLFIVADDGSFSNRKPQIGTGSAGELSPAYVNGGSVVASLATGTPTGLTKIATAYAANNYAAARDGANLQTDTNGALPASVNTFRVGAFHNGTQQMDGHIRRLTYWSTRLSNDTLQTITR